MQTTDSPRTSNYGLVADSHIHENGVRHHCHHILSGTVGGKAGGGGEIPAGENGGRRDFNPSHGSAADGGRFLSADAFRREAAAGTDVYKRQLPSV